MTTVRQKAQSIPTLQLQRYLSQIEQQTAQPEQIFPCSLKAHIADHFRPVQAWTVRPASFLPRSAFQDSSGMQDLQA